jgi:hypothetical protein
MALLLLYGNSKYCRPLLYFNQLVGPGDCPKNVPSCNKIETAVISSHLLAQDPTEVAGWLLDL